MGSVTEYQSGWHKQQAFILTVLVLASPKSRCQQIQPLLGACPWLIEVILQRPHMEEGVRELWGLLGGY